MSLTFTKLFSSITESTVWVEPYPTRIAWVAMLANADRKGRIFASVPGLAKLAGITLPEVEAALHCFMAPDRYSRTKEHDGRRIEEIDGGWRLLNFDKYRELRDTEERREYQREWDRKHRGGGALRGSSDAECRNLSDSDSTRPDPTKAEAEEELNLTALSGKPDESARMKNLRAEAVSVLSFLNAKTGRNFLPVEANVKLLVARFREGFTPAQCRQVIAKKSREWGTDEKMETFLRPKTLFNATNFANYCGELVTSSEAQHG